MLATPSRLGALSLGLLLLGAACATGPDERLGRSTSAIINGTADTTHPAVVALIMSSSNQSALCSGTIVKVDAQRQIGWVATAAHCVDSTPVAAIQGTDFTAPDAITYRVLDYAADPRYDSTDFTYDFAMVRILGVDATTPVIPLTTSPDGVAVGTSVTSVGFGRTSITPPTSPSGQNTVRRVVQKTLDEVTSLRIGYDMATKGICQGDSGGPVLVGTGTTQRVVGIHSFVAGDCNGRGYSGRVTAGLSFYNQQLAKALPPESCGLCEKIAGSGKNVCAEMNDTCFADADCKGFYDCLQGGKKAADCAKQYPLGEGPFYATASCICTRGCADLCSGSLSCVSVPTCGYQMERGTCATCVEGSCCQEESDCAADGQCYVCLKSGDADAACASNALRKKLAACTTTKCKDACAAPPPEGSGETPPSTDDEPAAAPEEGAADPGTTTTTTGCATTPIGSTSPRSAAMFLGALAVVAATARRRRR